MEISESVGRNFDPKFQSLLKSKVLPYVILSLFFLILVVPLVLKPEIDIFDARDESSFHYPTIQKWL